MRGETIQGLGNKVRLIVGLGNPGSRYRNTYHNVGEKALSYIAKTQRVGRFRVHPSGLWSYAKGESVFFMKPLLFMNEAGRSIAAGLQFFRVKAHEMLVIHDDSDILIGQAKFSFGRGSAGHRGVASLIKSLGTKDFWRLRIGIRQRPGKAGDFVLRKVTASERKIFHSVFESVTLKLKRNERFPSGVGRI